MIYTIGIRENEFEKGNVQEVYDYFKDKEFVEMDSETSGFSCHNDSLLCFQLGDFDNQWVIHPDYLPHFKYLLENKTLLGQNIRFDLKFLYKNNIWPRRVWDTFLAESVLTCGLKQVRRDLATIARKRLNMDLDKSVRDNIWREGLTRRVIEYSADDVKYLGKIKEGQEKDLVKNGLEKALDIENEFVLCLAYIEYCGFKLNKEAWTEKCKKDIENKNKAEKDLDKWIIDNNISKFIDYQLDLFSIEKKSTLNWNSSTQVVELFEHLKIPVLVTVKGVIKKSVEAKHIEKYKEKSPIVGLYLYYKECEKLVSTYGYNFIEQIDKTTGRLHTNFRQILDTSRTSSGGKNRATKEKYLNFQNIPSDKGTRSCFIAENENSLIISDYSGQEQVVLANKCLDKNLLEFYDNGFGDMHAFIAQKMYPELKNVPLNEIAEKYKDKRQNAKIAGFTITFGGNESTISGNQNISLEQAKNIIDSYFGAFPEMREYFDNAKLEGLLNGYILISEQTGRKSYIEGYNTYLSLKKEINRGFWEKYKLEKLRESSMYLEMKEKISTFYKIQGAIERKSLNYGIQGQAAEISKIAGSKFFRWILENNYQNKVLIPNFVHDEYIAESPKELTNLVSNNLQRCMEEAGLIYCKRVKLKAQPVINSIWIK